MRDQHFQRTCQCSEQCRMIAKKLNTAILKGIPPLKVKINDKKIRNCRHATIKSVNQSWTYFKSNSKAIIRRLPILWIRLICWIQYTTWKRKYHKHFRGLYFDLYINRLELEFRRMLIKYTVKAKEDPGKSIIAMIGEPNTLSLMLVHVFAVQIRYARE